MAERMADATRYADKAFLGHPRGLAWLSFSEVWERFSYYGMQALLVLYMTHYLLLPGHIEHVAGFGPFRAVIESAYGPLSPQALASVIFGLYAGLVYLTPIAGGLLADRFIGRTRAVIAGAVLMAAGHFLMAFEASFLLALLCLLIGIGCFKGNIATQVGELYAADDPRRADAYQIYMLGIQLAVIVSPLVCGTLGQVYGWHWGFGAAGVGMLIGLAVYLSGRAWLPPEAPILRGKARIARAPLAAGEGRTVLVLALIVPVLALGSVGNSEIFNAYLVWGEANYQLVFFGKTMPITWILSFSSIISAATIVLTVMFWRWWAKRWTEPDEITKLTIGVGIAALAPLTLAAAAALVAATGQKVGLGWAVAFELINDFGFANFFPVGLALFSRAAPKALRGMMIGVFYLHLFIGNMLVGWLGGLLERMPGTAFWLMHSGLITVAAMILLGMRSAAGKVLAPTAEPSGEVVYAA
ncbi:MAG: amino acid/peptide transporter [Rhodospirillales bacterium]|nr:amino acid/peptide transporter [Rhodospirillales bacterium]